MELSYPKIAYYLKFLYYKMRIIVDCRFGRRRLYVAEFIHIWNTVFHTHFEAPGWNRVEEVETIFGKYKFIGDNYGYSILSPAFERPDIELFIRQIAESIKKRKNVLFLDIGANVGLYTVGVSRFIQSDYLQTISIEPDPVYHMLLLENIKVNSVPRVRVYNVALGDQNKAMRVSGFQLNGSEVSRINVNFSVRRLDSIIPKLFYQRFDEVFLKIDIEGHEEEAFDGAKYMLASGKKIRLMIEDCVNPSIIRYLKKHGFRFMKKITPYDSFWEKN